MNAVGVVVTTHGGRLFATSVATGGDPLFTLHHRGPGCVHASGLSFVLVTLLVAELQDASVWVASNKLQP